MTHMDFEGGVPPEPAPPTHVTISIEDIDPDTLASWSRWESCDLDEEVLARVGRAYVQAKEAGSC